MCETCDKNLEMISDLIGVMKTMQATQTNQNRAIAELTAIAKVHQERIDKAERGFE